MTVTTKYQGYITNESNSKRYYFRCIVPFKDKTIQPSIDVPIVNTGPSDRFIFRFTGQANDISFTFVCYDDGDDTSNFQNIISVKDQVEYLKSEIFTHEFDTYWTLVVDSQFTGSISGVIDSLEFDTNTAGTIRVGNITFKQGRIGGL